MHKVIFYPLGNADCCQVILEGGRRMLFDYAARRNPSDPNDKRIDLPTTLRDELAAAGRDYFDTVAFTHADDDHIAGAPAFFRLEHDKQYRGAGRIAIRDLWVPAALIIEDRLDGDAKILQDEARYRLRNSTGVRVFSRPARLEGWLRRQGLTLADRAHLITDAGQLVPGYAKATEGVEFFAHSPFAARLNGTLVDRNECSLVLQATFATGGRDRQLLLTADTEWENFEAIVAVTRIHGRPERLAWDIVKVPHHCSYGSLGPDKGAEETKPTPGIAWLYNQGRSGGIIVSTSKPIPADDADSQPPHRQAANYYRGRASAIGGQFVVTMAYPTAAAPRPLVILLGSSGAEIDKARATGPAIVTGGRALRAG